MKQRIYLLSFCLLLTVGCSSVDVDEAKYSVVKKDGKFEIRDYESQILAETVVDSSFQDAGNKAFGRLFRYISGDNISSTKIAMTAPVSQESAGEKIAMTAPVGQRKEEGKWVISFMMPDSYTMKTIPKPKDSRVFIREVPGRRMAAVRYSGRWTTNSYNQNKTELEDWMSKEGLKAVGEPIWARYNHPYKLWFLKRNEVLFQILKDESEIKQ